MDEQEQPDRTFESELTRLLNSRSMENGSGTPDFVLSEFLTNCLAAFDCAASDLRSPGRENHRSLTNELLNTFDELGMNPLHAAECVRLMCAARRQMFQSLVMCAFDRALSERNRWYAPLPTQSFTPVSER